MLLPQEADVIVVGAGGSGLAAAVEAARAGAGVVVVEKNPAPGGSTAMAIGSITAAGTWLQHRRGVRDDTDTFVADMLTAAGTRAGRDNPALRRLLAERLGETVEWLRREGVGFFGPFLEPPHRVPRMHNVVPAARVYIQVLQRAALRAGARIYCNCRLVRLLRTDGRVSGCLVQGPGGETRPVLARRGVILATGDYTANAELKAALLPPELAAVQPVNPAATGDGHLIGQEAGGKLVNMDVIFGPALRFPPPNRPPLIDRFPASPALGRLLAALVQVLPLAVIRPIAREALTAYTVPERSLYDAGAILFNAAGDRFCNERDRPEPWVAAQPDGKAWLLLDSALARRFSGPPHAVSTAPGIAYAYFDDYRRTRPDIVKAGANVAALARRVGVDPARLTAAVDTYNQAMAGAVTDPFGRSAAGPGLHQPPFYAMGPVTPRYVIADGGLMVDTDCRVLDEHAHPIPHLYAVGCVGTGGLVLAGHGLHIGWAITSGRIAGRAAATGTAG